MLGPGLPRGRWNISVQMPKPHHIATESEIVHGTASAGHVLEACRVERWNRFWNKHYSYMYIILQASRTLGIQWFVFYLQVRLASVQ